MDDDADGMTSGTSTLGSVASADMELGTDWPSFLDGSNAFGHPAVTDASGLPQLWNNDMDLSNYDEDKFLSIDPRMSMGPDADPFGLMRDPMALYTEPMDMNYGERYRLKTSPRYFN